MQPSSPRPTLATSTGLPLACKVPWNSGGNCIYRQKTPFWGVKLFRDERVRDKTYSLTNRAYECDLGPRARLKFRKGSWFGYAVQHCTLGQATENDLRLLTAKLSRVFSVVRDVRGCNVGTLSGHLVMFDFSEMEF